MHSSVENLFVINPGSSSDKLAIYQIAERTVSEGAIAEELVFASIDWNSAKLNLKNKVAGDCLSFSVDNKEHYLTQILPLACRAAQIEQPTAVVIRVVHGGKDFHEPVLVDSAVLRKLSALSELAPLHNLGSLNCIEQIKRILPAVPVIAVFDTAFHATIPLSRRLYALPYEWYEQQHIQKYGFHGINHEYCAAQAIKMTGKQQNELRILSCHLGSGASLCAIAGGKSVDTTMGFTPLEGLVMGTRCGTVDPGILLTLLAQEKFTVAALSNVLYKQSGLLGLSGISSDMRLLEKEATAGNTRALLAIDVFINRLVAEMAAMIAALGGVDGIVFTGGIGENSSSVREKAIGKLAYLGVKMDDNSNLYKTGDRCISSVDSSAKIFVVHAREELQMAKKANEIVYCQ